MSIATGDSATLPAMLTSGELHITHALVLDDHAGARQWLAAAVASAFPEAQVVVTASIAEAETAMAAQSFDLALLDLGLPDGSGLRLLPKLIAAAKPTLCVIATIHDDDENLFAALKRGAQGYVLKDQSRDQLADMLRAMASGQPPLSPGIARRLLRQFVEPAAAPAPTPPPALSPREREVLALIGKGFSVQQSARALVISPHTAHDHVRNIYRKLAVASRAEAAIAARELGLS